ncbi:pseudouridine synthase [Thermovibrio sp.]
MRLDRLLAESGFGSRSQVKRLIKKGRVEVDGEVVKEPSFQVDPEKSRVFVDGEEVFYQKDYYVLLNKPSGYITSTKDRELTVMELVCDLPRFEKLFPVGRLDKDAEGLLILTTDGELAHRLTHPKWKVPKTYEVVVEGRLTDEAVEPLRRGIELKDFKAKPAQVEILEAKEEESRARITISEGKYHQVKRMFGSIGHPVKSLKRVKFGPIELGELPVGEYRHLTEGEVDALREAVKLPKRS